jgi:hypothetical protein
MWHLKIHQLSFYHLILTLCLNVYICRNHALPLDSCELGGGGDCFFHSIVPSVGMPVPELRRGVAQHMRDNEDIYGGFDDFARYGRYPLFEVVFIFNQYQ